MLRSGKQSYRRRSLIVTIIVLVLALIHRPADGSETQGSSVRQHTAPGWKDKDGDINAKIAQLKPGVSTMQDVVRLFGKPIAYKWEQRTFTEENLPRLYIATFMKGLSIRILNKRVSTIRFGPEDLGYVFRDKIRIGSSLDDVLAVLGTPDETVMGEPIQWKDRILYRNVEGREGFCYYLSAKDGVELFLDDYKVTELWLTDKEPGFEREPKPFDDCRGMDLRIFDLSGSKDVLVTLWLDQKT